MIKNVIDRLFPFPKWLDVASAFMLNWSFHCLLDAVVEYDAVQWHTYSCSNAQNVLCDLDYIFGGVVHHG